MYCSLSTCNRFLSMTTVVLLRVNNTTVAGGSVCTAAPGPLRQQPSSRVPCPSAAGKEIWAVVSSSLALARQNPTPFVSAVRIVEREEAVDRALLEERGAGGGGGGGGGGGIGIRPLPPGRPRCWRERFFQVRNLAASEVLFSTYMQLHRSGSC